MTTQIGPQRYKHVQWIDLNNDGVIHEVLVIKEDKTNGDIYFIKTADLNKIDRMNFLNILKKRDAHRYPLWDLLDQTTLKNGMNALELYHQLVMNRLKNGKIVPPGRGVGRASSLTQELGGSVPPEALAQQKKQAGRPPTPKV